MLRDSRTAAGLFDDTVDIFLRAGAGGTPFTSVLFPDFAGPNDPNVAPNNALTDGVDRNPEGYLPIPVSADTGLGLRHAACGGSAVRRLVGAVYDRAHSQIVRGRLDIATRWLL